MRLCLRRSGFLAGTSGPLGVTSVLVQSIGSQRHQRLARARDTPHPNLRSTNGGGRQTLQQRLSKLHLLTCWPPVDLAMLCPLHHGSVHMPNHPPEVTRRFLNGYCRHIGDQQRRRQSP